MNGTPRTSFRPGSVFLLCALCVLCGSNLLHADSPTASYIFPAGARRGTTVPVIVGGLNLYKSCGFEMLGPGVTAERTLLRTKTLWFEGPVLPLPDSQQQEDYPKDMAGRVTIAADAPLGWRYWRVWTAQGATSAQKFVVGDLPEVVEQEIDGDPVPVEVKPPVTINGRIFPREDVDVWTFAATKGQTYTCEVAAARLGSPLEARLEVRGPDGRRLAEKLADGGDPVLRFTAPADGRYAVRIQDVNAHGGQAYVYRLTITGEPYVDRVYPLGGKRGSQIKFEAVGQALPATPIELALPADAPPDYAVRLNAGGKLTNPVVLDLDDLPEYLEGQTKSPLAVPAILNGRIVKPGDVGTWDLALKKGEAVDIELRAGQLGSPLRGVLVVLDAAAKELARADAVGNGQVDPSLRFTPPADGTYRIRVAEQFRHRGGPDFAYRLRVAPPGANRDFRLTLLTDVVSADQGGKATWKVTAERLGGFNEPITLTVEGLPPGVTAKPVTIAAGQITGDFAVTVDKAARLQASRLTIRGSAKIGEQVVTRTALWHGPPNAPQYHLRGEPGVDSLLLAVTLPTPFQIVGEYDMRWAARGTVHHRKYRIERHGYDGRIEVMLADHQARHLQGVGGPTITVAAGATEFDYPVTLPPWMETGRTSRTCVMGVALLKDKDGEHVVSFTSINTNDQVVAVIEPDPLDVEPERGSITAMPGQAVEVGVNVSRARGLEGPVRVELIVPGHMSFITAAAVEVPAGQTKGVLAVRFAADARGPYNMPVMIRATLMRKGEPVVAEAKLDVRPAGR